MGFLGIALKRLKDSDKDKIDGWVHSIVSSPDINSIEKSILLDEKLADCEICTEENQTEIKEPLTKIDSTTSNEPK